MVEKNLVTRHQSLKLTLTFLFFISSLCGCAQPEKPRELVRPPVAQWPAVKPAITWVKSINKFESEKKNIWGKIAGAISGQKKAIDGLVKPVSVTVGRDGSMAIADPANGMVHFYDAEKQRYLRITATRKGEELAFPVGVAFDKDLRLFVSDSFTAQVHIFDRNGRYILSIKETTDGRLKRPTALACNAPGDKLYVADTAWHKIHIFDMEGRFISSFGGRGTAEGRFNFPTYIFCDQKGLLYVTDAMNFRVQIFNADGKFVARFGHHGDGSGDFAMPKGIAVDESGVIYMVDSLFDNVQLFNLDH